MVVVGRGGVLVGVAVVVGDGSGAVGGVVTCISIIK